MKKLVFLFLFSFLTVSPQEKPTAQSITVRITKAAGNVYFLDCVDGFGAAMWLRPLGTTAFFW